MEIIRLKDNNFFGKGNNSTIKRNELRKIVVDLFGIEKPGDGKGDMASKYEYVFEDIYTEDNKKYNIFLQRPANLHNRI